MAHQLTKNIITKKFEMAYVGEKPWHGLGQQLTEGASIDEWKHQAGMAWEIKSTPVLYADDQGVVSFPGRQALYRGDTRQPLAVVSDTYQVVQPGEILEFFRDLVAVDGMSLHTAGTLFGGRRFWALASMDLAASIGASKDQVKGYVLLISSCDGSLTTIGKFTAIRVVCNNTATMALSQDQETEIRVPHSTRFRPELVKERLAAGHTQFRQFVDAAQQLSRVKTSEQLASEFIAKLLHDTKTIYTEDATKTRQHQTIMQLYQGAGKGAQLPGVKGTAWGLVNAVTEFVDHHARVKTPDARLESAWTGRGDKLKTEALHRALELV